MRASALAVTAMLFVAGCGGPSGEPTATFTVAAAASLSNVVGEALERWNADPQHSQGRATFAASSTLARQIESGAPYDLFLSANREWVDRLVAAGHGDAPSDPLATNFLAIVSPALSSSSELFSPGVLLWPMGVSATQQPDYSHLVDRRWATADPAHVPLGRAARAHLDANGWWERLRSELVVAKDARAALRLVERGEVQWGIVYWTDAESSDSVRVHTVLLDHDYEAPRVTGLVVEPRSDDAAAFLAWLAGIEGQALWKDHGFSPFGAR